MCRQPFDVPHTRETYPASPPSAHFTKTLAQNEIENCAALIGFAETFFRAHFHPTDYTTMCSASPLPLVAPQKSAFPPSFAPLMVLSRPAPLHLLNLLYSSDKFMHLYKLLGFSCNVCIMYNPCVASAPLFAFQFSASPTHARRTPFLSYLCVYIVYFKSSPTCWLLPVPNSLAVICSAPPPVSL
jgi:hypothetical protein